MSRADVNTFSNNQTQDNVIIRDRNHDANTPAMFLHTINQCLCVIDGRIVRRGIFCNTSGGSGTGSSSFKDYC